MADPKTPPLAVGAPKTPQISGAPPPPKHEAPKKTTATDLTSKTTASSSVTVSAGVPAAPPVVKPVEEPQVRSTLASMGRVLAVVLADADVRNHWRFTDDELDGLTPPMTNIINRRPALAAAVHRGDEIFVAIQLAGYMGRNIDDGRTARRNRQEHEHELDRADTPDLNRQAGGPGPTRGGPTRAGLDRAGDPNPAADAGSVHGAPGPLGP